MIRIVAENLLKEGKKEAFKELCKELIEKSQAEAGCIEYDLYEDTKNPNLVAFLEAWKDEDALAKHGASEHFTRIVPTLKELTTGGEVHMYTKAD